MIFKLWSISARDLVSLMLVLVPMTCVGPGVAHAGSVLTGVSARRLSMMAAGVDLMPVGTAKQVSRLKRARGQVP